jgi:uncharacterized surface protein with fasciclin (FAS1) repeats
MQLKKIFYLAAAQEAVAQSLSEVLASHNNSLSTLVSLLNQQPQLVNTLAGLKDITILAPSDEAFRALLADPAVSSRVQSDPGFVPALLSYHVLNGTFYASDLLVATNPVFVPSLLTDPTFSTVFGGQRVQAQAEDSTVVITTGNGVEAKVQATVSHRVLELGCHHADSRYRTSTSLAALFMSSTTSLRFRPTSPMLLWIAS